MRKLLFLFLWLSPFFAGAAYQPAMWQTFYKQSFTSRNLSTTPLTVGGLKGDAYDYKVILVKKSTGTNSQIWLRFNGDSATNYREYYIEGSGSTITPSYMYASSFLTFSFSGTDSGHALPTVAEIAGKSGGERTFMAVYGLTYNAAARVRQAYGTWTNTADELTSLVFFSNDNVAQTFDLIILQKPKLAQDAEWELVERKTLSSTNLSNGVWFSGLDGDRDEEYLLKGCFTASAAADVNAHLNSDAGANYTTEFLRNNAGTAAASNNASASGVYLGSTTPNAAQPLVFEARIKAKSGVYRQAQVSTGGGSASYSSNGLFTEWWRNTADKLENIKLTCAANATGYIELYRRGKSVSASKPTFETLKAVNIDGEFSQGYTFDLAGLGIPDADNESMFVLEYHGVSKTAGQANMAIAANFNGDSGSNYYVQSLNAENSTARAFAQSQSYLSYWLCGATYPSFVRFYIFPKSGKYRPVLEEGGINNGSYAYVFCDAAWWLNTADKIRSIKVYAASANQTQFKGKITLKRLAQ